jgi:tetratricopeptide (TPR) repeat protein
MVHAALVLSGPKVKKIAWLVGWATLVLAVACVEMRAMEAPPASDLAKSIQQKLQWIHDGERQGMSPLQMARLWASLASDYEDMMELQRSEDAYNHALKLLETTPEGRIDTTILLSNLGSLYVMKGDLATSARYRQRALDVSRTIGDPLTIARSEARLAEVHLGMRRYDDALREADEAYREMVLLNDSDKSEMVSILSVLVFAECDRGHCDNGLDHAHAALALARSAYPGESLQVAQADLTLGYAEWKSGKKDGPDEEMREGIRIMKENEPPSHPFVLSALEQYRSYLQSTHHGAEAKQVADELAQIQANKQAPCMNCTVSVNALVKQ